jgi:hypothetical protein
MQAIDLEGVVSRPSWNWLAELATRLNVVIEVIDANDAPMCPVGSSMDAALVRTMLTNGDPALRSMISTTVRTGTPTPVVVTNLHAVCFRLAQGGALLLARTLTSDESADECREDLESIGPWLSGVIDASLAQPNAVSVEGYRIVSFRRILREATVRGSFRKVIGAFVEALSVWDDVRVRVYARGANGGHVEYASTMTAHTSSPPEPIDDSMLPRPGRMARLSRFDVDRLGLVTDPGDTVVARMLIGTDTEWVLVFSGLINDSVQVRLRVYSDILRESMNEVLTNTTTHVVAELSRRQIPVHETVATAAQTALGQLTAAIAGGQAALVVTTTAGRQALTVGNTDLLPPFDRARGHRLVLRSSDAGSVMTVVFEREHAFMAFEREIAQAGVTAMHPWVEAALPRSNEIERRGNSRSVDIVFDQLATDAVAAGQHASMIVMSIDTTPVWPGLLSLWVARIRGQLRAGDRAGVLSDREIAVMLYGASADQAAHVCARLQQVVEAGDDAHDVLHPAIGMTTREPDAPFEGSLVGAARAAAARR